MNFKDIVGVLKYTADTNTELVGASIAILIFCAMTAVCIFVPFMYFAFGLLILAVVFLLYPIVGFIFKFVRNIFKYRKHFENKENQNR